MALNDFVQLLLFPLVNLQLVQSNQIVRSIHSFIHSRTMRSDLSVPWHTEIYAKSYIFLCFSFFSILFFGCTQFFACTHNAATLPRLRIYANDKRLKNMLRNQRKYSKCTHDFLWKWGKSLESERKRDWRRRRRQRWRWKGAKKLWQRKSERCLST